MPGSLDRTRKEKIARYAVNTKKQVVKTYVVVKWARRAADDVQKAMVEPHYRHYSWPPPSDAFSVAEYYSIPP